MNANLLQLLALGGLSTLGGQRPEGDYSKALLRSHCAVVAFELVQQCPPGLPKALNIFTRLDTQVHEVVDEGCRPIDQKVLQQALHGLIRSQRWEVDRGRVARPRRRP